MRVAVLALLLAACAGPSAFLPPSPPQVTTRTRYVPCMDALPALEVIDWPDEDKMGNVLMHRSTVERVQAAYANLRRYADEQFYRCRHLAEERGEQSVEVEVEP